MNFFGHAAIAGRFEAHPLFVLGSMLPDFCNMLALAVPETPKGLLGDGVRFHHVTDHAFHGLPAFRELYRAATTLLDERGVRRGTARAVAHVGVELLIDAELAENDATIAPYVGALRAAQDPDVHRQAAWPEVMRTELRRLAGRLEARGVAKRPATRVVVERLERALSRRPRLMIAAEDLPKVSDWVELFRARVVACAPALVDELTVDIERRLAAHRKASR